VGDRMHKGRATGALAAALLALGLAAGPAGAASVEVFSSGSRAAWDTTNNRFRLSDISCDGNPVYINWQWGTSTSNSNRINYNAGCGNSQLFTVHPPSGTTRITFRTCTDKQDAPDNCSGWVTTTA
jgi:hypothetical protein